MTLQLTPWGTSDISSLVRATGIIMTSESRELQHGYRMEETTLGHIYTDPRLEYLLEGPAQVAFHKRRRLQSTTSR